MEVRGPGVVVSLGVAVVAIVDSGRSSVIGGGFFNVDADGCVLFQTLLGWDRLFLGWFLDLLLSQWCLILGGNVLRVRNGDLGSNRSLRGVLLRGLHIGAYDLYRSRLERCNLLDAP
jgi:hypothetical protein